jgi:DNA-binding NtrC family response regulator
MGGRVSVESHLGQGTTMRVVLPHVAGTASQPVNDVPSVEAAPARTTQTLLLVEDEAFVRELVRDYLRAAGYRVLEAGSGEDALALLESDEAHVDLLITDVVLPGMNGAALADELGRRMPGMDTLFMSGYAGDSMFGADTFEPGAAFLPKPFTRQQLTGKVREMLTERAAVPAAMVASFAASESRHLA